MSRLKRLIDEIHRRSLWQVLLIYCGAALVAYQAVQALTEGLGLPQWFPAFAIVLFIVGLPIVLATAFVHDVAPPMAKPPEPTPLTEAEAARIEAEAAAVHLETRRRHRFLTWRNAAATFVIVLAAWGVVATGWYLLADRAEPEQMAAAEETRRSIAVLPFENLSPDPGDTYFADGAHHEIISRLSQIAALRVTSRTSVMKYRGEGRNIREIGQELGVTNIVEGTVRRAGDRIRITTELIDAENDEHLWSETYERDLGDVLAVQSDIAEQIAVVLRATLTSAERARIATRPTASLEAHNSYLLGRFWWNQRTQDALTRAIEYFQEAIDKDNSFALALVGLADAYAVLPWYSDFSPILAQREAAEAATKALELDEMSGEAHTSLGAVRTWFEWDWQGAEREFRRAIELSPSYANAHHWYGLMLAWAHRFDAAISRTRFALELDPLSPIISTNLADAFYFARRYDEAVEQYQKTLELFPEYNTALESLGRVYLVKGMYEDAIEVMPEGGRARLAYAYVALGRRDQAVALLEESKQGPLLEQLRAHVGLGQIDEAFTVLEQALEERLMWLVEEPNVDPYYDILRSDPRFQDLLRRMNLPH